MMSLDVYLITGQPGPLGSGIFVRQDGQTVEITRTEWDEKFPGREPIIVVHEDNYVFNYNITHNLGKMAAEAGIYDFLWRPDEHGLTLATQLIEPLKTGLHRLQGDPDHFKQFNPSNGWGDYDGLVKFVAHYLQACETWPNAQISVSR